jgi:SpoVK/Ycf46/Vps4 family AAA+-type ATPase
MIYIFCFLLFNVVCAEPQKVGPLKKDWLRRPNEESPYRSCHINGMLGEKPGKVCSLITDLINNTNNIGSQKAKRIILYGPQGTGKSFTAEKIAEESGSIFVSIDSSTIVSKYIGQGSQTIERIFKNAIDQANGEQRPVVLFFDEIDTLVKNSDSEMRSEHASATTTLWLWLDKTKDNPNICFIAATNKVDSIHPSLKSRVSNNLVEIKNPDVELRKQIIIHFLKQNNYIIADEYAKELADAAEGLCERDFELLIRELSHECRKNNETLTTNMLLTGIKDIKENVKKKMTTEEKLEWYRKVGNATEPYVRMAGVVIGLGIYYFAQGVKKVAEKVSDEIK